MHFSSRVLLAALLLLTLCRFAAAAAIEISPQEAYLWQWSKHWTLTGFDGGGLAALLVKGGSFLDGPLAIRWFAPVIALGISVLLGGLVRVLANDRAAEWSVVLVNLLPGFNYLATHAVAAGPGTLLALAGIHLVWKGLHRAGKWGWHWPLGGAMWGLGLWCDWSGLWLPLCLIFLLIAPRRWRRRLFRPGPWLLLVAWAAVGLTPHFLWNHGHGGAGWQHLAESMGAETSGFRLGGLWDLATHAVVGLSPIFLLGCGAAAILAARRKPLDDGAAFLLSFLAPPLALFAGSSLLGLCRPSYLLPALPLAAALYSLVWFGGGSVPLAKSSPPWLRFGRPFHWNSLLLAAIMSLAGSNTDLLRRTGILKSYQWDATRDERGWATTADEAASLIREASHEIADWNFLIADNWKLAAALDYHLPKELPVFQPDAAWPRVHVTESPVPTSQYAFWPRYDAEAPPEPSLMAGKTALFFTDANRIQPPDAIVRSFLSVEPLMVFDVIRDGALLRRIKVFACYDYSGLPL